MLKKLFCLIKFIWFHPLNQNNRLAAVWRMMSFQIASRIIKAPIILPFINDTQLITTHGMTGATGDWYCGLREYEDMGFLLHALQSGDLFVDVGATIGSYSILAGACEGVKVIAFEPVPQTFSWLQKNIKINALENRIEAMNIGLAEQKGSLNFSSNLDSLNHVVLQEKHNTSVVKVDVSKLDDILDHKYPTVIKIDVEGYELQVLNGAKKILDNPSLIAVIVELNGAGKRYGVDDEEIHKLLLSKKFETFKYNPLKQQLTSLNGKFTSVDNTLYLRKLNEVKQRISKKSTYILGNGKKI